jgi:hypothetical protein
VIEIMKAERDREGKIRWLLARQGLTIVNLKKGKVGLDPFVDIRRLAHAWNYPMKATS